MESKNKTILIIGGNSDIGQAVAIEYARLGYDICLTTRNDDSTLSLAKDLHIRFGVRANTKTLDVLDFNAHASFYDSLEIKPDGVVCCVGYLNDQLDAQSNWSECLKSIHTNFTGLASLLNIIADDFEKRKSGFIVGISSVAGLRGRQSNYIYGSAKSAFITYLSGLRNRLSRCNVHVLTVLPGFVHTKMTYHLNLTKLLTAQPSKVAKDVIRAQQKGKNTLYSLWFWKWIMLIITYIPEQIFKKMNL